MRLLSKCADWVVGSGGEGALGNHLRPGTFFKPPLIWASVRGSPGWSELPHCRQSKETISAALETMGDGLETRGPVCSGGLMLVQS